MLKTAVIAGCHRCCVFANVPRPIVQLDQLRLLRVILDGKEKLATAGKSVVTSFVLLSNLF